MVEFALENVCELIFIRCCGWFLCRYLNEEEVLASDIIFLLQPFLRLKLLNMNYGHGSSRRRSRLLSN